MKKKGIPQFKEDKALAVTSLLLKLSGGKCDKYWLNKVMYYVERSCLLETGQPIFFDDLFSIPWGPIVSQVKENIDLIEYPIESSWSEHFNLDGKTVSLKEEVDLSALSVFEENLVKDIFKKFEGWNFNKLKDFFHGLPEHIETNSREEICYEDILRASGCDSETIEDVLNEISYLDRLESSLNCVI